MCQVVPTLGDEVRSMVWNAEEGTLRPPKGFMSGQMRCQTARGGQHNLTRPRVTPQDGLCGCKACPEQGKALRKPLGRNPRNVGTPLCAAATKEEPTDRAATWKSPCHAPRSRRCGHWCRELGGPLASQWRCRRGGAGTLARALLRASAKNALLARDRSSAGSGERPLSHPGRSKLTRKSSDEGGASRVVRYSLQSCNTRCRPVLWSTDVDDS